MGTEHHLRARWPGQASYKTSIQRSGRTGLHGGGATNRWLTWMARITATQRWATARLARFGGRFGRRYGVTMRFVRPVTRVAGRLPYGPQAVWRFTPQVHLAIHRTVHQTLVNAAPVYWMLTEQVERGEKAVTSTSSTGKFVQRDLRALPARAQSDATVGALLPATVSTRLVPPLQRVLQLHASNTVFLQNKRAKRMQPLQQQPLQQQPLRQQLRQAIRQRVVTETVQQVIARSLQVTQRVAEVGQRVEAPAAGRNVSLQTARPTAVLPPAAADVPSYTPPVEVLTAGPPSPHGPGMTIGRGEPPVNVEQLTDQVVQAINRRTLAHLERTGRLF